MTRAPASSDHNPVALAKRAGCMLAGEDFILRRAAKDGDGACREVFVRLDEPLYSKLIDASRRYRQTPGALAGDYVRQGLADISRTMKALKGAVDEPDADLILEIAAERAKVRQLEQELAEEIALRVGAIERMSAAEQERGALWAEAEDLQIKNDQLLTELASCARPLPPIVTITAKPERSPELNEALSQMATKAAVALREKAARLNENYGPNRNAAEEAPSKPDAPLTPAFVNSCFGYHWAGVSIEQIAATLHCDEAAVRRALKSKGRGA